MAKKNNKCWYCGNNTMELAPDLGKDWLRCSNCGATHQPSPTKHQHVADMSTWSDARGGHHYHPLGVHN